MASHNDVAVTVQNRGVIPDATAVRHPPLWQQLLAAASTVANFDRGQSATLALLHVAPEHQPAAQAMLFAVIRRWGLVRALGEELLEKPPSSFTWQGLLKLSLGLLQTSMYPAHTLVNQTVLACKQHKKIQGLAPLMNAILRRYLRERETIHRGISEQGEQGQVAKYNYPLWWIKKLQRAYPKEWERILMASGEVAPQHLRVDTGQVSLEEYQRKLTNYGEGSLTSRVLGQSGLYLEPAQRVSELPGFNEGVVSVQDAAAQLAAPALLHYFFKQAEKREIRILDACAAPGGKTLHLLQLARENGLPVIVTALDKDEERLQRVRENLMRANVHMQAECLVANATNTQSWWDGRAYDAILLDAPCSASGIVRRHPDIPWLRRESDIAKLAQEQSDLLQRLWPLLKPGGYLLYATCSIWPQEGIMQIEKLIQSLASAEDSATLCGEHQMLPKSYRLWTENNSTYETPLANKSILIQEHESDEAFQRNDLIDHDGFYFALLQKRYESG